MTALSASSRANSATAAALKTTMKAIQFSHLGTSSQLKYADVPIPTPTAHQILVQNRFCGVNFIDTYHRTGLYPVQLPYIPGREGAGVVHAVGSGVTEFKKGDRVAYLAIHSYAEYAIAESKGVVKLPNNVSFETGAAMLLQGITCVGLMKKAYPVQPGDTVLVHAAAGGCGLWLCKLCKLAGARVIGTTSTPEKSALARACGADEIIFYSSEDVAARVMELTDGKGVQAVFDGVGKATFDASLASLAQFGFMISYGNASGKVEPLDILRLSKNSVRLMRTSMADFLRTAEDFQYYTSEIISLIQQGKLVIHIHKIFPLADAAVAHDELEGRLSQGKILLDCKVSDVV